MEVKQQSRIFFFQYRNYSLFKDEIRQHCKNFDMCIEPNPTFC